MHCSLPVCAIVEREAKTGTPPEHELRVLCAAGTDTDELVHYFAGEQRIGAFENSLDRLVPARAILWQLTVARLGQSNLEFLAANGID